MVSLVQRLVEIGLRRRRDAVRTEPEVDLVEVEFEDAVLAEGLFDPDRQDRLLDLAGERHLVVQQHVLGDLLGDRGGADRPPPLPGMRQVERRRADDRQRVDAGMGVEILVLGGDEGLLDDRRDGADRHEDAPFGGQFRQQAGIAGIDPAHDRRLVVAQPVDVGQVGAEMLIGHVAAGGAHDAAQQHDAQHRADHAAGDAHDQVRAAAWVSFPAACHRVFGSDPPWLPRRPRPEGASGSPAVNGPVMAAI